MFINYIPFLILSLINVNAYFEKKKSIPLILNITLMILTSFYFSIPGLIVICLYALYYYIKHNQDCSFKKLCKEALYFLLRLFLGVLLAGFFLLPEAYVILSGRSSSISITLTDFLPSLNLKYLMYGTYGVGLTAILWIGLIYNLFFTKKENRIMAIFLAIITCIPIFSLILNGGLYANGKCFIPFIPLYLLLIGDMLKSLKAKKLSPFLLIFLLLSLVLIKTNKEYMTFFIIDLIITFLSLYYFAKRHKYIFLIPIVIISFISFYETNKTDNLVSINEYQTILENQEYDIENYIDLDKTIYRTIDDLNESNNINFSKAKNDYRTTLYSSTSNPFYSNAFYNTFNNNDIYRNKFMLASTNNLFFERFMGVKYLLTNKEVPYGYYKIKDYKNGTLYENDNVFPIGFASSHILNTDEYNNLSFNSQLEAFQNNVVIDDNSSNAITDTVSKKIDLNYQIEEINNLTYEASETGYKINSSDKGNILLKLNDEIDDVLIIRFAIDNKPSCKSGDIAITINDVTNKLTCKTWKYYNGNETFDYVISSNDKIDSLDIQFIKGYYEISNIEVYEIPKSFFTNLPDMDTLEIDFNNTKGDYLTGNINVNADGYFIFTIPYDEGFEISVDGINTPYTIVNEAFIGFKIKQGEHTIKITYNSPWFKEGKIISLIALLLIICLAKYERKKLKL
jgi:uncharacterized membrane protein YfhO